MRIWSDDLIDKYTVEFSVPNLEDHTTDHYRFTVCIEDGTMTEMMLAEMVAKYCAKKCIDTNMVKFTYRCNYDHGSCIAYMHNGVVTELD